ncbi:hypothetical protein V2J09_004252 [Rumex salicifolius]
MEAIEDKQSSASSSALIFLGTGCSSAVPYAMCLIRRLHPPCTVCSQSLSVPPKFNPNYRCNTSLLIDYRRTNEEHNYILIDVGKTFREQVLRWFTHYKIPRVDSIVLTHEHADAVLGLDDLHDILPFNLTDTESPSPIHLSYSTMLSIAVKFPHLVETPLKEGQLVGETAQLDWRIIESDCEKPFIASGLQFVPLPVTIYDFDKFITLFTDNIVTDYKLWQVMHGEDYLSLGFLFGETCKVAYVSDVSRFPPTTEHSESLSYRKGEWVIRKIKEGFVVISKDGGGQVDLLILDANTPVEISSRSTHFCLSQTLDAIKRIRPKKALLIGMNHDFDHHNHNLYLEEWSRREGILVQLAHDGLRIPIQL